METNKNYFDSEKNNIQPKDEKTLQTMVKEVELSCARLEEANKEESSERITIENQLKLAEEKHSEEIKSIEKSINILEYKLQSILKENVELKEIIVEYERLVQRQTYKLKQAVSILKIQKQPEEDQHQKQPKLEQLTMMNKFEKFTLYFGLVFFLLWAFNNFFNWYFSDIAFKNKSVY